MSISPRVTIRDIARKANMHFTTVSLALRNSPKLKSETREKIQKLAESMGYRPDPMLAALNAYRQANRPVHYQASLAWVHNWANPEHLYGCEEFNQYYMGACDRAAERGYNVEEFALASDGITIDRLHRILRARNIQGTLLAPQPSAKSFLDLRYDELSAVAFGFSMRPAVLHLVTNHHYHTMMMLMEKVLELGYRRPALCIPRDWNYKVDSAWQSVFLLFLDEHPELARIPIYWATWDNSHDRDLAEWIRQHNPDVILGFNEAKEAVENAGFRIPEDVAFASAFLNKDERVMSGVYQNDYMIGQKAVDMVIDMLHRGETGIPRIPVRMLVEGEFYPGTTMPDLRKETAAGSKKKTAKSRGRKPPASRDSRPSRHAGTAEGS